MEERRLKNPRNKAISTVFGSILFIILVVTVASILFFTLYRYNQNVQEAIIVEDERTQEKIVLRSLANQTIGETEYITAILLNNTGTITCRIRAIYINNKFLCDPSDPTINQEDTYINANNSTWINLPGGIEYEPNATITAATERGMKSTEYEWKLIRGSQAPPPPGVWKFYFGPLMLDFNKFYYTECNSDGSYDPSTWKPGWSIEKGSGSIVWNITVKNVDDRNITINQFSCFTLVPNDEPSDRNPWYIEPDDTAQFPYTNATTQFIASNETVYIIYKWKTPKMKDMTPQSIYNTDCRNKVFLTFFGIFHEHDGTTKPYGQTIPFESVLVRTDLTSMEISAQPTTIAVNSTMTSTITVIVRNTYGDLAANETVTFSTDLGALSSSSEITNTNGIATVTLYPSTTPGTAHITATWQGLSRSTTVIINAVPVALFTETAETVNTGEVINFDASDSYDPDGSIVSYFWDFGDGLNAAGVTASHAYTSVGVYTVILTVTDNRGATASASATKTVQTGGP